MKEMTLDEVKKCEIDIMCYIDELCCQNEIKYTLGYGTLLGAVRHKGFIPWDDDIDIILTSDNYKKLLDVLYKNNEGRYKVVSPRDKGYWYGYGKVVDTKTLIYEKNWPTDKRIGVNVDLFHLDYLPDENPRKYYDEVMYYEKALKYCLTDIAYSDDSRFKSLIKRVIRHKEVSQIRKKDEWYWKEKFEKGCNATKTGKIMCPIGAGIYREWDKHLFDKYTKIAFEQYEFSVIENYKTLLEQTYGDYMKLPPKEQQVSNHDFIPYWRD